MEFNYLPINVQSVFILPISEDGAVVVGTNKAKSLRFKDLNRIRAVANVYSAALPAA